MEKGYVQVYTGNGKGKTTASFGVALRSVGAGHKVYIGQFMKGQKYSETLALQQFSNITIEQYGDPKCIRREEVTEEHIQQAQTGLKKIEQALLSEQYHLIIVDEINVAIWFGLISCEEVLNLLKKRPHNVEIICTGRYAPQELIDYADLVTEMKEIKHYYQQGVLARKGIEN